MAEGFGVFFKAGLNVNEPVGSNGTIVVTGVPVKVTTGVPRGITGRAGDALKPARDARVRLSLALRGFETDPNLQRYGEISTLFNRWEAGMRRVFGRIRSRAPDAAEDVADSLKEGRTALKAARLELREGNYEMSLSRLKLARDHYDEAFATLQRTLPAVSRR